MPFSDYIILGPSFTLGRYKSVRTPNIWRTLSDRERVIYVLELARRVGKPGPGKFTTGPGPLSWVTTPTFYEVGINLFRNEMSRLEREEDYIIEKEQIHGIRVDGRPRKWYRYRLIRKPGDPQVSETLNLFD